MNTYSSYKDSGIEWMGNIPESWELTKNRFGFLKHKNGLNESDATNVLSLTTTGVKVKRDLNFGKSSESYIGHQLVEQGDIVFTPRDFDQTPILSDVSKYEGCISNLYIVDKTKENVLNRYVNYYWYGLKYSVDYFKNFSHGMRYSFNRFQFDEIPLLIPSLREQQQISDYLDYKTSKIDILIEKTQQKIELLKEQRSSLINTTVTKGLNSDVEMKDSGIEWIGETPIGWNITRLINLGVFSKGKGIVKDDIKTEGHPCVRGGEVYTQYDRIFNKTVSYISDETVDKSILFKYKSILFAGDGETLEDIGKCIVYNGSEDIYIGGGINVFTPIDTVNHIFLSYLLNSDYVVFQKSREGRGQIIVHIYQKQLREIRLSIPPHQEQQQIVDYLDSETSKIDKLVDIESKRIILLKEYRQSLISEVVTGKVDIRDEVLM